MNLNRVKVMNLLTAEQGKEYIIQNIETDDEELNAFLFSLGCYSGEPITVWSLSKMAATTSMISWRRPLSSEMKMAERRSADCLLQQS